jgi:hypothetical protein
VLLIRGLACVNLGVVILLFKLTDYRDVPSRGLIVPKSYFTMFKDNQTGVASRYTERISISEQERAIY